MIDVSYPNILDLIKDQIVPGRTESASFLIWYLENYYRLDALEAVDSVCDQNGDKGVDGIYINDANSTIDIFQTKISQNPAKTIGDTQLKEFFGTLSQFKNKESIQNIIDTGGAAQVVSLIKRLQLMDIFDQFKVRGLFISNIELDHNGKAYLANTPNIEFIGKDKLQSSYISSTRSIPMHLAAEFDISGLLISKHYADVNTSAFIVPVKALELVNMPGISDQSVFAYNVRGPLGGTSVNRDIVNSIRDRAIHKKFPLFHNGITIVTNKITETEDKLRIETFFVVNGCQSLTALYDNQSYLTDDLKILTKFVQVSVDSDLSRIITQYSNNQNGVKARDFKSNNAIQVRLQNEFRQNYGNEFYYEIKRGEQAPDLTTISNEAAGIYLMAFDSKEPWNTTRKYQVFDEKYIELFGRPEVTAHRILMLYLIDKIITAKIVTINNKLVAKYNLTKVALMYILRLIFENDNTGRQLLVEPELFVFQDNNRQKFVKLVGSIIGDIIVDFNAEVDYLGEDFDYRSKLRDEVWVKKVSQDIVSLHIKLVKRQSIESFEVEWNKDLHS